MDLWLSPSKRSIRSGPVILPPRRGALMTLLATISVGPDPCSSYYRTRDSSSFLLRSTAGRPQILLVFPGDLQDPHHVIVIVEDLPLGSIVVVFEFSLLLISLTWTLTTFFLKWKSIFFKSFLIISYDDLTFRIPSSY